MGYNITGKAKLNNKELSTADTLCVIDNGGTPNPKIVSYTSKLVGNPNKPKGDNSEISVTYEHEEYIPGEENSVEDDSDKDDKKPSNQKDNKK